MEQRSRIKFCVKNAINGTQTFEMLQKAFGDETLLRVTVLDWHRLFKEVVNLHRVTQFLCLSCEYYF